MMEKFYVRDATSDEQVDSKIWEWDSMPFYDELQREVHTVLGGSRAATKASIAHLLQYAVATVGLAVSMRAWLGGSTLAGVVMGHCIWLCCVDVIHAATHYAVFVNPELNVVVGWLFGWFHHVPAMWMRQHVLGHHPYTNVPGLDPDLEHFTQFEELGGGWRLSGILKPVVVNHWRRSLLPIASIAGIGPLVGETLQVRGGAAPTAPAPPPGLAPRRAWSERAVEGRGHASLLTNIAPPAGPGRRRVHEVHPPEACAGGSRPDAAAHVDLRLPRHRAPALGQPLAPPRLAPLGRASPLPLPETFGSPPARPPRRPPTVIVRGQVHGVIYYMFSSVSHGNEKCASSVKVDGVGIIDGVEQLRPRVSAVVEADHIRRLPPPPSSLRHRRRLRPLRPNRAV
jgi:hypothetical protein